jgi:hypothetical protein
VDPLHATIEDFAAEGYTHVECFCPRCRVIMLRPTSWLPKISMGLTLAQLSTRLRCAECGGPLQSVKRWRMEDVIGKLDQISTFDRVRSMLCLASATASSFRGVKVCQR